MIVEPYHRKQKENLEKNIHLNIQKIKWIILFVDHKNL